MGLDPIDCSAEVKNINANSDGYVNVTLKAKPNCGSPNPYFDLTGATEIKVSMLNADASVLTLKMTNAQVAIVKAQLGQLRFFYTKAQSALLALGIGDLQIVITISGQDSIFIATQSINVIAERFAGV